MLIPLSLLLVAQTGVTPRPAPLRYVEAVADKNFYCLRLIEEDSVVKRIIQNDSYFKALTQRRGAEVHSAFRATTFGKIDSLSDLLFTSKDIDDCANEFQTLYVHEPAVRHLVDGPLRKSGAYERYRSLDGQQLLARAWRDCAEGMNGIVRTYGLQTEPTRTPLIDAPLYDAKTFQLYGGMIKTIFGVMDENAADNTLFFQVNRRLATEILRAHNRDEAGRLEPLERGENRNAYARIRGTEWSKYRYSVILVPGLGPENTVTRISPVPRLLLSVVAKRWRAGVAPYIFVTGGYCYPNRTPYSEALEMKRTLISEYKVSESAIVVDPHARHTTTNVRNCVRLMYRYGVPMSKTGLILTNTYQADDIVAKAFFARCQGVFGYQPATNYKRIGPFDLEFKPNLDSLSFDPRDPLDP